MLSTGLSLNNSIKRLERVFKAPFHSISNMVMEARNSLAPANIEEVIYQTPECRKSTHLRISRTVLPDERLDYNQTFQHIRYGLEEFYKEHYPNFSNYTTLPHQPGKFRITGNVLKTSTQINYDLNNYPTEGKTLLHTTILPTGIAKTVLPDESRDFNDTFVHIRVGLDQFYKEKNPIFTNTAFAGEAVGNKEHTKEKVKESTNKHLEPKLTFTAPSPKTLANKQLPGEEQITIEDQLAIGNSILSAVDEVLAIEKAFLLRKDFPAEEALVENTALSAVYTVQPTLGTEVTYTYTFEEPPKNQRFPSEAQPSSFQYTLSHNYSPEINTYLLAETNIADELDQTQVPEHPFQQTNTQNPEGPTCTRKSLRVFKEEGRQKKDMAHRPEIFFIDKDRLKLKNRPYNTRPSFAS